MEAIGRRGASRMENETADGSSCRPRLGSLERKTGHIPYADLTRKPNETPFSFLRSVPSGIGAFLPTIAELGWRRLRSRFPVRQVEFFERAIGGALGA